MKAQLTLLPRKEWDTELSRWRRLLELDSPKDIWYAINWKGELKRKENKSQPSPSDFKDHFEKLLLVPEETTPVSSADASTAVEQSTTYIPVLDDPITSQEMDIALHDVDPNKACDRSRNSPGVTRILPPAVLLFILQMFNIILQSSLIPIEWTLSKLITLFKRGKTQHSRQADIVMV